MTKRTKIALVLMLTSWVAIALLITSAGVEYIFDVKIKLNSLWVYCFTTLPLVLGFIILQPKIIFFLCAVLIPFGSAMVGAVTNFEIWKKWYYWTASIPCVAYMFWFLLNTTAKKTIQSELDNPSYAVRNSENPLNH